jgi:hypothetical protein
MPTTLAIAVAIAPSATLAAMLVRLARSCSPAA